SDDWRSHPVAWVVIGISCCVQALSGFAVSYLRGAQRFDRVALLTVVTVTCQLAGVIIGALLLGVVGALIGSCAGNVIPAAVAFTVLRPAPKLPEQLKRRVLRYGFYAWAAGLAVAFVWSRAEVMFLDRSWGSE